MEQWHMLIPVGLACGIFSAMFGVGSGIIMVPAMVLLLGSSQKSAQGISLAVMVPMALVGAIRYKMNPEVRMDMTGIALLAAGGAIGALLGAYFVEKVPGLVLRRVFAAIMMVVAVKMFLTTSDGGQGAAKEASAAQTSHTVGLPGDVHENKSQ